MSAEEIDKIFRDKLNNRPVTPSPEAWQRLQTRMAPPVEEKKPVMWYYSAAAAVTLLVTVGLWTANREVNPFNPEGSVATVQPQLPAQTEPVEAPAPVSSPSQKKEIETEATISTTVASTLQEQQLAASTQKKNTVTYPASKAMRKAPEAVAEKAVTLTPEPEMMAAAPSPARSEGKAAAPIETLEIIVKLDNQSGSAVAQAAPLSAPEAAEEKSSSKVLKGILKQVKNIRDGEKVSLADLGITKHTYALETRIGNKTITKSIEL